MDEDDYVYPAPTQWLGTEEDNWIEVVDYDGESLRVKYQPRATREESSVGFTNYGEGPVVLSPDEAVQFANKILELVTRFGGKS